MVFLGPHMQYPTRAPVVERGEALRSACANPQRERGATWLISGE